MENNPVLQSVGEIPTSVVIAWIIGIIALIVIGWKIAVKIYQMVEGYRKQRNQIESEHSTFQNMQEVDNQLVSEIESIKKQVIDIRKCSIIPIRRELRELTDKYTYQGYIPSEEFDEYEEAFELYIANGGNGAMRKRVEKAMSELPVR